jgi:histidine triad (HIT) family protein
MSEGMSDTDCIFCQIVGGTRISQKVLETDEVLCFMDIFPASEGHVLVIPKQHCTSVFDIPEAAMTAVASAVWRVAAALRAEFDPDGMTISQANGAAAGQTVMHYHVHLIPRSDGERLRQHGSGAEDPGRLDEIAAALAARL